MYINILKKLLGILVLFVFTISTSIANNMQNAQRAIDNKEYSTAIIHLKNELKENPTYAQARFMLGRIYFQQGKIKSSIKELSRAHKLDPDNEELLISYAEALGQAGEFEKMQTVLQRTVSDKELNSKRLSLLGYVDMSENQLADAKSRFNEANKEYPTNLAYIGLTKIAIVEEDTDTAQTMLNKAFEIDPDSLPTLHQQAKLFFIKKQYKKALNSYNQLITKQANHLTYYIERATTLTFLQEKEQAKEDIQFVLDKNAHNPNAHFLLSRILLTEGDFAGAKTAAEQVIAVKPNYLPALYNASLAYYALKQYNQAEKYLTIYVTADPENITAQNLLAQIYLLQQKPQQALLILEEIPEEEIIKNSQTLFLMSKAHLALKETQKAIQRLNQAKLIDPKNEQIQKLLITTEFTFGDLNNSIKDLEKLSTTEYAEIKTDLLLVMSYIKQGNIKKAEQRIIELQVKYPASNPEHSKIQNTYAVIILLKGNIKQAISLLKEIVSNNKDDIASRMSLARILVMQSKWSQAQEFLLQVTHINNQAKNVWVRLANIAEKQNNPELQEKYLLSAIQYSKNNADQQMKHIQRLSQWYLNQKEPIKILLLAEQLKIEDDNIHTQIFLAQAYLLNQQNNQAEQLLKKIILRNNDLVEPKIILARLIATNTKRTDEALKLLNNALYITPEAEKIFILQAEILAKQGRYEEALAISEELNKQNSNTLTGNLLEANIYILQKKYMDALTIYQQAYKQRPNRNIAHKITSTLLLLKEEEGAIESLSNIIKNDPQDIDSIYQLAILLHKKQQLQQAAQYYRQVLKLNPKHSMALNNYAWVLFDEHNIKQAVQMAKTAYQQSPSSAAIADSYGWFLIHEGEYQKGVKILEDAASQNKENYNIQYHLALAYAKNNQQNKALYILEEVINYQKNFSEKEKAIRLKQKLK